MTEPYRPSNGTEGEIFMNNFCYKCERNCDEDNPCMILGSALAFSDDEEGYPKEWVQDNDGSNERCTAFIPEGSDVPPERCKNTKEMF